MSLWSVPPDAKGVRFMHFVTVGKKRLSSNSSCPSYPPELKLCASTCILLGTTVNCWVPIFTGVDGPCSKAAAELGRQPRPHAGQCWWGVSPRIFCSPHPVKSTIPTLGLLLMPRIWWLAANIPERRGVGTVLHCHGLPVDDFQSEMWMGCQPPCKYQIEQIQVNEPSGVCLADVHGYCYHSSFRLTCSSACCTREAFAETTLYSPQHTEATMFLDNSVATAVLCGCQAPGIFFLLYSFHLGNHSCGSMLCTSQQRWC